MKFPRSVRSGGMSLVVAVSLLLSSQVDAQRPAARPAPTPNPPPAAVAVEKTPAATFDTLLSADAYGVYAEVRMVGRQASSQEMAALVTPLTFGGGAPDELMKLYEFIKAHAEPLMTARLMFATMRARAELPETLIAIEMPSVEEARKFLPQLKQFIAANVAPQPSVTDETLVQAGTTPAAETSNAGSRARRRRARTRAAAERAGAEAVKPPPTPPVHIRRSGSMIAMSNEAFTFKNLRGKDQPLLVDEPGFQAARTRFSTDSLFIYFNTVRMFSSSKKQREALEKEYRRQAELAEEEARKRGDQGNADTISLENKIVESLPESDVNTNANSNNSNVAVMARGNSNRTNANIATTPEDEMPPPPPATPEATPSPKSEKELEEERRREQTREFVRTMGSLVFGDAPGSTSTWPESIGVGVSLEADALVARGLFVNLADDQPLRPIPFFPVVLSGPSIASEAPAVLPAATDIFLTASLDLPQMYDYLASMLKILDLTAASGEEKGGFAEQLISFEKMHNFRIKEDLLAALGNEIAIGLPARFIGMRPGRESKPEANAEPPLSGPIVVIALNDKSALQELLPRVLASVGFPGATEENIIEKQGNVEVLNFSGGTLAFIDRFLVSAPDAATMRRIADAYNNGETLANSERFRDPTSWQSKQAVGQVYVSNAMLKEMFGDVTKAVNDIDDPALRAFLIQLNPEPGAITHSATRESNGLMHELHLPKNVLSLLTASELINQKLSALRGNEATAQWKLTMFHTAQQAYKTGAGRYGTVEELKAASYLNEEYADLEMEGYDIRFSLSGDKYEATATPKSYPKLGRRSFYIDHTGDLRGDDKGGKPASASDPIIDQ